MFNKNGSNNGVHKDTAIVARNGNGAHNDPAIIDGHELLWDGLPPAVTTALGQPIDPALVSQRKGRGGRVFDYPKATPSSTKPTASSAVRRVTRHRIPNSVRKNSEEILGPTDPPRSESLGGK